MDALPVTEETGLPFASKVTTEYRGQPVGVMHACGHDAHTAILMGVAELLAARREQLAGELMVIFQPAEEGPPEPGAPFGARWMLDQGLFADWKPEAVYGLHVWASLPAGMVGYRSGPTMAAADEWVLTLKGAQTHGSRPWDGIDPLTVAAQVQLAMQSIVARQVDIVRSPVVLTTGAIQGGVRYNIIPEQVTMTGTLRSFDEEVRADVVERIERTARASPQASGASAEFRDQRHRAADAQPRRAGGAQWRGAARSHRRGAGQGNAAADRGRGLLAVRRGRTDLHLLRRRDRPRHAAARGRTQPLAALPARRGGAEGGCADVGGAGLGALAG
jgi:amidohydrolase